MTFDTASDCIAAHHGKPVDASFVRGLLDAIGEGAFEPGNSGFDEATSTTTLTLACSDDTYIQVSVDASGIVSVIDVTSEDAETDDPE